MLTSVNERLRQFLQQHDVSFDLTRHEPVYTSEQAALVRGTSLASGAKALVCKTDDRFVLFVLRADMRLASKAIRKQKSIRSFRFASRQEVERLTGLMPGSIPPFGSLFQLPTCCDQLLIDQPRINFNAGDHAISISMDTSDYIRVERPDLGCCAETA